MKSEELERSLRADFENFLNEALADIRKEISEVEERIFAEIEKQKREVEELFRKAKEKISEPKQLDEAFKESILEHLRLARDEGAQIAAMAHAEAEELERQRRASEPGFADLSQAIKEISSKTTQADILKALISNAEKFSACGALFVVKNERLIGWHTFGYDKEKREEMIKSIVSPINSNNILSEAVNSLTSIEVEDGNYSGDMSILRKAGYGLTRKAVAIPLVVRGRGVAVLYAEDSPEKNLLTEALESLVCVTSMTVEVLASMKSAAKRTQQEEQTHKTYPSYREPATPYHRESVTSYQTEYQQTLPQQVSYQEPETPASKPTYEFRETSQSTQDYPYRNVTYAPTEEVKTEPVEERVPEVQPTTIKDFSLDSPQKLQPETVTVSEEVHHQAEIAEPIYEIQEVEVQEVKIQEEPTFKVEPEIPKFESPLSSELKFEAPKTEEKPAFQETRPSSSELRPTIIAEETPSYRPVTTEPPRPRISTLADRHIELPVEVTSEEERRYHNEARRFARLLVSEIKLYNQQKVEEGRRAGDLYDRLREAIDRSREMYDKRVKPSVAAKFDYFHYELVQSLAEGDATKLGPNYPGPKA